MDHFRKTLVGAEPVAMDYEWLITSLSVMQAATPTARAHLLAKQDAAPSASPREALLAALAPVASCFPAAPRHSADPFLPEP